MHANLRFKFITDFSTLLTCQIGYMRYKINACIYVLSHCIKNMSIWSFTRKSYIV